ncbi:hypothetical protein [Streptomyces sp. SID3212]|uniref:hypothetical protein n=1 Tax=Streptomyces sp. SID3212 TaxID=2690259 RepID=UPI001F2DD8D3|nr:hypothetical protein [Streptomyces sp. SID3212]
MDVTTFAIALISVGGTLGGTLGGAVLSQRATRERANVLIVNGRKIARTKRSKPGVISTPV